ncbi:tetraacyldisaccharide 4'-kinase [Flavobacterium caeni]|uniref:Tetraacyldisaccharide 4'-kinase n=1 Tax=Flavobacterium caeni TaxID=490189 RepID=A0A1G5FT97_9FLAO|nr:tetraacyldisaccharide 4'-kinase [Flavobacterium caeni]SCY42592.1 lipid-A-disaccharide kinase [Flavobacterium caeni]
MVLLRKILFPLAILYGWVTQFRNFLFDRGLLASTSYDLPVIAVGNLSVGGTGKSPMIEYLIRLLSANHQIATLSRGYKRTSKGFVLADAHANAFSLGDEPYQFHQKFPGVHVAVDADRRNGIAKLLQLNPKPGVILLDDAYQHRKVKAGFYILLTAYGDLYADDFMLPTGNLRESTSGARRADVVVVTKCPPDLPLAQRVKIEQRLNLLPHQALFFAAIAYDDFVYSENARVAVSEVRGEQKLLLAGIAKPKPFFDHLKTDTDVVKQFPDHHDFSEKEIAEIVHDVHDRKIITTEKDYVRLKGRVKPDQLFYLPIKTVLLSQSETFDQILKNYVGTRTANR